MGNSPMASTANMASINNFYNPGAWVEGRAEEQLQQTAGWDGMQQIAAFPDLHPGRHGPVGAAFLADRIYPQLVGPDIGCGMALFILDLPRRKLKIDKAARRLAVLEDGMDHSEASGLMEAAGISSEMSSFGIATLGGGNHFAEIQSVHEVFDQTSARALGLSEGRLCLLIHTGSRGLGAGIFTGIEDSWKHGFHHQSEEAQAYIALHDQASQWAKLNRSLVARKVADALRADVKLICDAPHNYVEEISGLWLHRKGAARPDGGLAPLAGSRETQSYLLRAENLPAEALGSLSHGAGRRYDRASMHGRIKKNRTNIAAMEKNPFGGTVVCENRDLLIEEAGHAYKNASDVVSDLEAFDIAKRIAAMNPLITYKTSRKEGRK